MRLMRVIRPLPALTDQPVVCQMRFTHSRGFTLLEVMVALAILAVALAGIMTTISTNVANAAGLKERTFANWAATLLAAFWGAGAAMPLAAQGHQGTAVQEAIINGLLFSLSAAMIAVVVMVLWGLRGKG